MLATHKQALKVFPPRIGLWGRAFGTITKMYASLANFPGTPVDLVLEDKELSLESYGIRGKILYTPGHSPGSTSLLLATGEAFVGDLAVNGLPLRIGPGMSIFGEDVGAIKESYQLLLTKSAKWIYPAHGKPFKADALKKFL